MPITPMSYITSLLTKIGEHAWFKVIGGLFLSCVSFLWDGAMQGAMTALLVLIVFDSITAIAVSYKSGEHIESRKVFRSAIKVAIYFMLISAGHLAEMTMAYIQFIDDTILGFLAATELVSILENTGKLGYAVPQRLLNQLTKYKNDQ